MNTVRTDRSKLIAGGVNCNDLSCRSFPSALLTVLVCCVLSCTSMQTVRVDLDTYLSEPEAYSERRVIITASLTDVLDRYNEYRDRELEVSAPFSYYGRKGFWTWYILLEQDGAQLRCFTHHYRLYAGRDARDMLMKAAYEQGTITVTGVLLRDGIDIKTIRYKQQLVRPDVKPPVIYLRNRGFGY